MATDAESHQGWLELLRFTTVYTGRCSCGWTGNMTDKGRARRALHGHQREHGVTIADGTRVPVRTVSSKPPV